MESLAGHIQILLPSQHHLTADSLTEMLFKDGGIQVSLVIENKSKATSNFQTNKAIKPASTFHAMAGEKKMVTDVHVKAHTRAHTHTHIHSWF